MSDALKDILSSGKEPASSEELLKYLQEQLDAEQRHELEKKLLEDEFAEEAMEGLEQVEDPQRIALIVDGLNRDLKKRTADRRKRKATRTLKPQWALYFSVLIFLIIIILVYLLLHKSSFA